MKGTAAGVEGEAGKGAGRGRGERGGGGGGGEGEGGWVGGWGGVVGGGWVGCGGRGGGEWGGSGVGVLAVGDGCGRAAKRGGMWAESLRNGCTVVTQTLCYHCTVVLLLCYCCRIAAE